MGEVLQEDDPSRMILEEEKQSKRLTLPVTSQEAADIIDQTTPKYPGDVLWTTHAAHLLMATVVVGAALVYLRFVLVPLLMSYFAIFLIGPVMDLLEFRPYQMGTNKFFCRENWRNSERKRFAGTLRGELIDICLLGKVPHMVAVLLCMVIIFMTIYGIYFLVISNVNGFLENELEKEKQGEEPMGVKMNNFANDQVDSLEESIGDIIRPWICETNGTNVGVRMLDSSVPGLQIMKISLFDFLADEWTTENNGGLLTSGQTQFSCERKKLFGTSEGYTLDEIMGILSAVMTPINDFILVLLLTVYILIERPEGRTLSGEGVIFEHIEHMVKNYVALKTILSAGTGLAVAMFLMIFNVPLAMVFGVLAFLFNYIPCVGSVIATFLPIPVLILDDTMSLNQKLLAFMMPASVQMYVGNVLEPVLFGSSLNLTSLSILIALTFCSVLWGICGAVLSVPLLGALKICLHHTDHPLAKHIVNMLREQASIDYDFDIAFEEAKGEREAIVNTEEVQVPPRNGEEITDSAEDYDPDFDEEEG